MKKMSLSATRQEYKQFQMLAKSQWRSVVHLIRNAMARCRAAALLPRTPLRDVPVFAGRLANGQLPSRAELYDDVFGTAPKAD